MKFTSDNITFNTGKDEIVIKCPRSMAFKIVEESMKSKHGMDITVVKSKGVRSLDSNSYLWILLTKLSKELSKESPISKEEIYRQHVREGNCFYPVPVKNSDLERFEAVWGGNGTGWFVVAMYPSHGIENHTTVYAYYGSSQYDSVQMSRLIDRVVQDCKALDIEVIPPQELQALNDRWEIK